MKIRQTVIEIEASAADMKANRSLGDVIVDTVRGLFESVEPADDVDEDPEEEDTENDDT